MPRRNLSQDVGTLCHMTTTAPANSIFPHHPSPEDWQALLADPDKHWRRGFSARTLAHGWLAASGFPPEVASIFAACPDPLLAGLRPVEGTPEFQVALPGSRVASQNDIYVRARTVVGEIAIMVEGKVEEPFDETLTEWQSSIRFDAQGVTRSGKPKRLQYLQQLLGRPDGFDGATRYQLLHRAASALIQARAEASVAAILLVHSFSKQSPQAGWSDYRRFLRQLGMPDPQPGQLQRAATLTAVPLFAAWVPGNPRFLST
jgi:hypothetical protein